MTVTRTRGMRRPILWGAVALVVSCALVAGGWALAAEFRSPAQIAAAASPPPPSVITAEVTSGRLSNTITFQGEVAPADSTTLTPAATDTAVITDVSVTRGDTVSAGTLALDVSNHPVFFLPGSFPFFRDLTDGDRGRDVEQLQIGLAAAGFGVTPDGVYGPSTQEAVRLLYARAGYTAQTAVADEQPAADDSGSAPTPMPPVTPTPHPTIVTPAADFLVAGSLPATVLDAPSPGPLTDSSSFIVTTGASAIGATILSATASSLSPGMAGTASMNGEPLPVTISNIGDADDDGNVEVQLTADDPDALSGADGADTLITLASDVVADDALLVPSTAVASRGDARFVLRQAADGSFDEIAVTEIGSLNGTSAVEPDSDDALSVGDAVRVS